MRVNSLLSFKQTPIDKLDKAHDKALDEYILNNYEKFANGEVDYAVINGFVSRINDGEVVMKYDEYVSSIGSDQIKKEPNTGFFSKLFNKINKHNK